MGHPFVLSPPVAGYGVCLSQTEEIVTLTAAAVEKTVEQEERKGRKG